jgi:hypothetical protein
VNTKIETPHEQARAYEQRKAEQAQRIARTNELKGLLRRLEVERREIASRGPEVTALIDQMKADLEYQRKEFLHELSGGPAKKRVGRIDFSSAAANAFIDYDRWQAAIPELAQKLAPNTPSTGRSVAQINNEIMDITIELGRMGVSV